jgi:hypothetical protein
MIGGFHKHKWRIKAAQPVEVNDHDDAVNTEVLYSCWHCPKVKVKTIKGKWTLDQLR